MVVKRNLPRLAASAAARKSAALQDPIYFPREVAARADLSPEAKLAYGCLYSRPPALAEETLRLVLWDQDLAPIMAELKKAGLLPVVPMQEDPA